LTQTHRPAILIDWATYDAARFACRRWHYSRTLPAGKLVKYGVWEGGAFIGVVIFSRGATPKLGSPYGLEQTECCELTRVALTAHVTPVSRIIALCLRQLRRFMPGMRLVVSFADAQRGHHGGIYQAGNWLYTGCNMTHEFTVLGRKWHPKSLHMKYGVGGQSVPWLRAHIDPNASVYRKNGKHRYLMPLDEGVRRRVAHLCKPYPKRAAHAVAS
jgi:hypothetical protein